MSTAPAAALASGQHYCPTCERMFAAGEHCPHDGTKLIKLKAVIDPLIGRVLDGRYTIREKLGQGGMGAVYRAAQHSVDREVAIKVVNAHLVSNEQAIRRFLREAKIASKLSHPNAVSVLDFGQSDDGVFFLVMELVAGSTLDVVIKKEQVFRPDRIVRIGMQVCDALESAHALQIVHRDLKPANIMLLSQGRDLVKVLDFGLAKSVDPDLAATTMTNDGALLGTPAYMPPELALGRPCDARSDLYSLGCVLYLMGAGRLPFVYESPHELIAAHGTEPAPPMTGVPQPLADVIDRMLRKNPEERFQSAAQAREALESAFDGRATPSFFPATAPSGSYGGMSSNMSLAQRQAIASSDTLVAAAAVSPSVVAEAKPRRRGLALVAALVLLGGGGAAFMATRGDGASPSAGREIPTPPAPAPAPVVTPPAPAPVATPTATTEPPPAAQVPASATTPEPAPAPTPTASPPVTTSRPARPKQPGSKPATTRPTTAKPESAPPAPPPDTAPKPAPTSKPQPAMPF